MFLFLEAKKSNPTSGFCFGPYVYMPRIAFAGNYITDIRRDMNSGKTGILGAFFPSGNICNSREYTTYNHTHAAVTAQGYILFIDMTNKSSPTFRP